MDLQDELKKLLKKTLVKGDFILTSGKRSKYYLNGRNVTLSPKGAHCSAQLIFKIIKKENATAVGGPTIGADPLVGALAYLANARKYKLKTFIIRKARKEHADKKLIEGPKLSRKDRIIIIDDTATTGKSLIESAQIIRNHGFRTNKAVVILDRKEGAQQNLEKIGIELRSLFTIEDLSRPI